MSKQTPFEETMDHNSASLRRTHHEISTSSDEIHNNGSSTDSANEWSVSQHHRCRLKKKKSLDISANNTPASPPQLTHPTTSSNNPFTNLPINVPPTTSTSVKQSSPPTPPPILIKTVTDYMLLRTDLNRLIGQDTYTTKSTMTGLTLKTNTSTAYRTAVSYLKEKNADFHTFQSPSDKPYRVAIRHLNPATPPKDIAAALEMKGHRVRNVRNAIHPRLKIPLALFFVDLEPADNNKNIFGLSQLLNSAIQVEEPYKRVEIPQCTKCQEYHHTKTYCNHPARCVKCGGNHDTATCNKTRDTPATCALCRGPHPANYKGCQVYQELQRKRRQQQLKLGTHDDAQKTVQTSRPPPVNTSNFPTIVNTPPPPSRPVYTHPSHEKNSAMSYAHVAALHNSNPAPQQLQSSTDHNNLTSQLTNFLTEFKNMITPLVTLLTTVITKLISP